MPKLSEKGKRMHHGGLAHGSTNSSKTFSIAGHAAYRYCTRPYTKHLLIGVSLKLLRAEVIPDIRGWAREYGYGSSNYKLGEGYFTVGKSRVYVITGMKDGDENRLRTLHNIDSVFAEEVAAMNEDFFDMAVSRRKDPLTCPVWASCNPTVMTNWVKRRIDQGRWKHQEKFTMEDNPTLTPEYIEEFSSQFEGTFKRRMIDGDWVSPEGLIYPKCVDIDFDEPSVCYIGADYAKSSVTAGLFFVPNGRTPTGEQKYTVTREYYWDNYKRAERTSDDHVRAMIQQAPGPIANVFCDPSAWELIEAFERAGVLVERAFNKAEGYGITDGMLQREIITVNKSMCPELEVERESLIYDRHGERPDPKCIDHATDCLRYGACGVSEIMTARVGR